MRTTSRSESLTKLAKYGVTAEQWDAASALGQRWCSGCKAFVDKNQFSSDDAMLCRTCQSEYNKKYSETHKKERSEYAARVYRENPERFRKVRAERWALLSKDEKALIARRARLRRYDLTLEDYDRMLAEQSGHCATCDFVPRKRPLCVDHDHETGANRGLLCVECNVVIGFLEKHRDRISAFEEYLKKFHVRYSEVT